MFRRFVTFVFISALLLTSSGAYLSLRADTKELTAEQIAEAVIFVYGRREGLAQIRRNGIETGRLSRTGTDGRTEEGKYEWRFVRGENSAKDRLRLDQKMPAAEYALVYGDNGRTFGLIKGASFTPRQDATTSFLAQQWHGIDALLRYKENGSTLNLAGKDKQQNVEFYMLDVTDKEKRRTRYFISAKFYKVLKLEYEEAPTEGAKPVKYTKKFYDYHIAQGTLVPYHTVLYEDGKPVQDTRVLSVTYGIKIDDAMFRDPDAPTTATTAIPTSSPAQP